MTGDVETIRRAIDAVYEMRPEGRFTIEELARYVELIEAERRLMRRCARRSRTTH